MKEVEDAVKNLARRLSIPSGFFDELLDEDDWSFVIKSHALIESSASELLVNMVGLIELEDIFSRLPLGDKKIGKVEFLVQLKLLESCEILFINGFSELRNSLVHNAKNINFTFAEHYKALNKDKKKDFLNKFGLKLNIERSLYKNQDDTTRFLENPKKFIWLGLQWLLAIMSLQSEAHALRHETLAWQKKVITANKELFSNPPNLIGLLGGSPEKEPEAE